MKDRIELNDSIIDVATKLSEGNIGALTVIMKLYDKSAKIDPQDFMGNFGSLFMLDSFGIYGSKIWMLYKDVYNENITLVVAMLRAVQLGIIGLSVLSHAIDNRGDGLNTSEILTKVKEELIEFQALA